MPFFKFDFSSYVYDLHFFFAKIRFKFFDINNVGFLQFNSLKVYFGNKSGNPVETDAHEFSGDFIHFFFRSHDHEIFIIIQQPAGPGTQRFVVLDIDATGNESFCKFYFIAGVDYLYAVIIFFKEFRFRKFRMFRNFGQ